MSNNTEAANTTVPETKAEPVKTEQFSAAVNKDRAAELVELAWSLRLTKSQFVRAALEAFAVANGLAPAAD